MRSRAIVVLLVAGLISPALGQREQPLWESPFFRFHAPPELAETAGFYADVLETARREAREHWAMPLNAPIDVYLWPRTAWDTLSRQEPAMRDVLAYVRTSDQSLIINHGGCRRAGLRRLHQTLVHEYVHAYLGRMIARWPGDAGPRRLPRWLEEGLAMAVADQTILWDTARLRWLGPRRMIPLMQIAEDFPADPQRQRQAYRQAADAVAFLLEERGGLAGVIDEIVDPQRGPEFVARAWDPQIIAGFEERWHATLRLGWRWMLIFTTAGFAWAVVMVLAVFAWRRRRRLAQRKVSRWAMEAEGLIPTGLDEQEQDKAIRDLLGEE